MYQRKLDRFDDDRKGGNFFCSGGHPADLHTQRVSKDPLSVGEDSLTLPRLCCT